jgi:hypothetical protein
MCFKDFELSKKSGFFFCEHSARPRISAGTVHVSIRQEKQLARSLIIIIYSFLCFGRGMKMGGIEQISKSGLAQSLYMYGVLRKYGVSPHKHSPNS